MNHTAYIGIGSNLGDRLANCKRATDLLSRCEGIEIRSVSKLYETQAMVGDSPSDDPPFVNGVVSISTSQKPLKLLRTLEGIESEMGRPAERLKGSPRIIDLDILLFDSLIMDTPRLKIPHPEMTKRLFVLRPMCDIALNVVHPTEGVEMSELEQRLVDGGSGGGWIHLLCCASSSR